MCRTSVLLSSALPLCSKCCFSFGSCFFPLLFAFRNAKYEQEGAAGERRKCWPIYWRYANICLWPCLLVFFFDHSISNSTVPLYPRRDLGSHSFLINLLRALPGIRARIIVKPITPHLLFRTLLATWARLAIFAQKISRPHRIIHIHTPNSKQERFKPNLLVRLMPHINSIGHEGGSWVRSCM